MFTSISSLLPSCFPCISSRFMHFSTNKRSHWPYFFYIHFIAAVQSEFIFLTVKGAPDSLRSRINTKMGGLEATKLPITGCLFLPISFFVVRCGFQSHTQVSFMHRPPASRVLHFTAYESRYDPEHVDPSPNTIWTKGKTGATQAWLPFFLRKIV